MIIKHKLKVISGLCLLAWFYFCLPKHLFENPTATVIESSDGQLLGAKISVDEQWRFPYNPLVPEKFETCILLFEDEYFYKHIGINPVSITKAIIKNIKEKRIARGASTLTQQTIRLARVNRSRTYIEKLIEMIWALRLELKYSKKKILALYTCNAPFGGNTIGLDAAAWRYYNRPAVELSWAEAATMAVLPNSPGLIYPGRNQVTLLDKRNKLLQKLLHKGKIDSITYQLSLSEPLPQKPFPLPQIAPHLLQEVHAKTPGQRIQTSINIQLQKQMNQVISNHYNRLSQNEIHNAAALVLDVKTRNVLAYVGNTPTTFDHHNFVNIITKPRSTGSILKPFLYCDMLDKGNILPKTLIADIPTQYGSYQPENFNNTYQGVVSADKALAKSLNVPAVRMLNQQGIEVFYNTLQQMKLKDINKHANHYGLSLILGGAESNLWDLCKNYAAMAGTLNHYQEYSSQYFEHEFTEPSYIKEQEVDLGKLQASHKIFNAASIYYTFESMKEVNRPTEEEQWYFFDSSKQIAWKTGTSFGFRDAWSIGVTKEYVVGVWVGNADGEGRPGLVGLQAAAPILFDVFSHLPKSTWFDIPYDDMQAIEVCKNSGYRANNYCPVDSIYVPLSGLKTEHCPYHKQRQIDANGYQVNSDCTSIYEMKDTVTFELPPSMAYYYKLSNPLYQNELPYREDCIPEHQSLMQFIYPQAGYTFYLPTDFDGEMNEFILKIAHKQKNATVFWYINDKYLGKTNRIHEWALLPSVGSHLITVVDQNGNKIYRRITIK